VGDAVIQDAVGECDPSVVHPGRAVGQNGKGNAALERLNGDIAQGRREDDVVEDDVVPKDLLKSLEARRLKDGANGFKGKVSSVGTKMV
jgi:hypothetical protein